MHPSNLIDMKDLLAHVYEKFGPEAVVLEVVSDPDSHVGGCGCMECAEGSKYDHEFYDDEDDYEGPGEMMREERSQTVTEEAVEQMDEIVGELRQASQTHAKQAARLQNLAAALKSLGG
jgi:hypothetical protein